MSGCELALPASGLAGVVARLLLPFRAIPREMSLLSAFEALPLFEIVCSLILRKYLCSVGLPGCHRRTKFFLTKKQVKGQKAWAEQFKLWTVRDWKRVMFSDESRINFIGSDGCQWCRRGGGEEFRKENVNAKAKYGGGHVNIWGCMTDRGFGQLRLIKGNLDSIQLLEIFEESLLGTLEDQFYSADEVYFQQDRDPKHMAKRTLQWLKDHKIAVLDWAASSPDMNLIEHVWYVLKHMVHMRLPIATSEAELWQVIQEEWAKLPKEFLDNLYAGMPDRVAALHKARGSYTKY